MAVVREVRDIKRFRAILKVCFEEGFDAVIDSLKLRHHVPVTQRLLKKNKNLGDHPQRLRRALERLGPSFIKLGQILSVRPDLIPKNYCQELERLQEDVDPLSQTTVKSIMREHYGKDLSKIFKSFNYKPIAAASISQVHKAVLVKNNKTVAVKIKRPGIRELFEEDIEIMHYVASLLEKHSSFVAQFNPTGIIDEFWRWTKKELDFENEARNARRFAKNFADDKQVHIPLVYDEYSNEDVIVLEFINGQSVHDLVKKKSTRNIRPLIEKGFESILRQVFEHGFFHGDPHPGNILITNDNKISYVDFGIVGRFDDRLKTNAIQLLAGVVNKDAYEIVDTLQQLSDSKAFNKKELIYEIEDALESFDAGAVESIHFSVVLEHIMTLAARHQIDMPLPFVMLAKTIITLEGVALEYDPKFDLVTHVKPYIKKLMLNRYNPAKMGKNFLQAFLKGSQYYADLPQHASRAFQTIEEGNITVNVEDTDIAKLSSEIDKSSNRIAYSMLITAFLIVGALTIAAGPIFLYNFSFISFFSFTIAGVLFLLLFVSILQERNIIHWR